MNGPVVRRRLTFLDRSGGAPPAPASNRRILPNRERCLRYWTRTSHRRTLVSCQCLRDNERKITIPASSPAVHRAHAGRRRAHTDTPQVNVYQKIGPDRRTPFRLRRLYPTEIYDR